MSEAAEAVVETVDITKTYGDVRAVAGVSMRVRRGEIYAFLGMNGAGKTTLIRMLLGMIAPTAGTAILFGKPVLRSTKGPWARVGYLVETTHAYRELTVRENLNVARRLRPGVSPPAVESAIERLGLEAFADRRAGTLSLGNRQRLGIAKALLHEPELLVLDEPANGLDPAGIVEVRRLLRHLASNGTTIFMSSHILSEVAQLADRVGIIHEGRLVDEQSTARLEESRRRRLILDARDLQGALRAVEQEGYAGVRRQNGRIEIDDPRALDRPDDVARLLVDAGHPPTMLTADVETLEDYFLRLVRQEAGEA